MRSRPGLASIITSTILLSAVTMMGTGTVIWEHQNLSANQFGLLNTYTTNLNQISENLSIEKVWFGTVPQKFINITMTNQSPLGITINQVQFSTTSSVVKFPINNQIVLPQKSNSLKINYTFINNIPITVIIHTSRNSTFSTMVWPQ